MNTPTQEVELVVELNSNILKTIHNIQAELQSFREDSLNERKEQQAINEALMACCSFLSFKLSSLKL